MKRKIIRGKLAKIIGIQNSERIINVVTGKLGSGKTTQTKKIIKKYARIFPKEKILILDSNNEYKEYKEIQPNQINTFRKPSRIVISKHKFSDIVSMLGYLCGGLLVFESKGLWIEEKESNRFYALLSLPRTRDIDVMIIAQSIEQIQPKLRQNTSVFRFHNSIDVNDKLRHIHPYAKIAQYATNDACRSGDKNSEYKFCYYDSPNEKIIGADETSLFYACHCHFIPQIRQLQDSLSTYGKNK